MSLHQLKPSTLSLSLLLLIWSFESPARSHPTPRVALHTGTLSEQGSRVMCPRAPTLYYNQEKLCLFESNWKEGCNLERSRLDLRASWGHRPPQVALSLLLLSICWNNTPHSVEDFYYYLDDSDGDSCIEKKFPLALCPCLSTVAYLIPFLSSERPSQCYHFTKEVRSLQCDAFENPDHHIVTFLSIMKHGSPSYERSLSTAVSWCHMRKIHEQKTEALSIFNLCY